MRNIFLIVQEIHIKYKGLNNFLFSNIYDFFFINSFSIYQQIRYSINGLWVINDVENQHGTLDCCGNTTLFSSVDMVIMAAKRSFRDVWLNNEDFQPWLSRVEDNPSRALCKICQREVSAELTAIKPEHNLPFTTADHLVDLMKRMFPDSAIAQDMNMKRTKCTEVMRTLGRLFDNKSRKEMPSLYDFMKAVPRIYSGSRQVLDDQWTGLDVIAVPPEIKDSSDIVDVYTKLGELKDG
ncbi:hypothetical protein Hamer_G001348, partial [Homarus americanus]